MTGPGRLAAGAAVVLAIQGLLIELSAAAAETAAPAVSGSAAAEAWNPKVFDYERPKSLAVEESTPTAGQVGAFLRPAQTSADAPAPKIAGPATPRVVGPFNVVHLRFRPFDTAQGGLNKVEARDAGGEDVPVLLCTPKDKKGPFPLVVVVHGLTSNKAQVVAQVGSALAAKGFAVMAPDLPCHGERPGDPMLVFTGDRLRKAVLDVRQCMDIAESRPEIDQKAGVTLVGYSLGSWVSGVAAGADPRVKALVLMVGGTFDMGVGGRTAPAMDVRQAITHYAGRPLLMLNGKTDVLVNPESSKRLFAAAGEPKKQVWYDSGHLLPASAYEDAAAWIDKTIRPANQGGAEEKKPAPAAEKSPAK